MKDPRAALKAASITAIESAMTAAGYTDVADRVAVNATAAVTLPYVQVGPATLSPWDTKTFEGGRTSALYVVWGDDPDEVDLLADVVLQALTDRTSPVAPGGGHSLVFSRPGTSTDMIEDRRPNETFYGQPIRVIHWTKET